MKIVAEIGSNHCGKLECALRHIEAAAKSGCQAVKFQLFTPVLLDARVAVQRELARWQLPVEWLSKLTACAHEHGLEFICTPFDCGACKSLTGFVDAVKISAYDLTYDDLVGSAARIGVRVILSTAMATEEEIEHAVRLIRSTQSVRWWPMEGEDDTLTLLQGVAEYPCSVLDMNLGVLENMKRRFGCPVGISDHTIGWLAAVMCTTLGGAMIEKHFKLDSAIESPDAGHSITAGEMRDLVGRVQLAEQVLGSGEKTGPLACERVLFETCRRSNQKPLRGEELVALNR